MVWTAIGWIDMGEDREGEASMSPREIREARAAAEDENAHDAENARRAAAGLPSIEEERDADLYAAAEKARLEQEERERSGGPRGQWWFKPGDDGLSGRLVNLGYLDDGAETPTLEMGMETWQVEVFNEISQRGETGWISIGHVQEWAALDEANRILHMQHKQATRQHVRAQRLARAERWAERRAAGPDPVRLLGVDYDEDRGTFIVRAERVAEAPMINLTVNIDADGGLTYDPE